ncbi:hypothetical protein AJ79_00645 [Helicocarpus griseus UAMH5409]|uniref:Uncharacterized protein n=1 Tax=Helicocarpus griseus UAMH5409 TaxID=1447875 RepID=A0A2B7Y9V4_9EURO|nr:hypothetical protein AJ79_00645 [Helicocarpus griseus UAMH5409]
MTGLKRKLDQRHELGSAPGVDSPQSEYYYQERNSDHLLLTANHPESSTPSSRGSRGGSRGGSRSRGREKGRVRAGRSRSLNGSNHEDLPAVQAFAEPQTPRTKRVRRAKEETVPENGVSDLNTPRPTRQSARILSKFHHMDSVPEESDDAGIQQPDFNGPHEIHVGSDEAETDVNETSPKASTTNPKQPASDSQSTSFRSTWTDSSRRRRSSGYKTEAETSPEAVAKQHAKSGGANGEKRRNSTAKVEATTNGSASKQASPRATRKRNSSGHGEETAANARINPNTRKLKMEKLDPSPELGSQPSNSNGHNNGNGGGDQPAPGARPRLVTRLSIPNIASLSPSVELESPSAAQEATPTEMSASPAPTPSENAELSASTLPSIAGRGRGRGGFRGRARGRGGWTRGRGRGGRTRGAGRGGRGGRLQPIDRDMSLSPSPVIKQLRERQKELDKVFRRVASAQRTALTVIANRSEAKLIKDPKAHMAVPEYDQVMSDLKARLQKRLDVIENEYKWRVKSSDTLLEANIDRVNSNFHDKARHIREEHLLAAQGSYMSYVEKRRQAEDDDHTETDESGSESEAPPRRRTVRGFNSSFVRDPKGAAFYERAAYGWDDFIQRAKIETDISPQIREIDQEARPSVPASDRIWALTQALSDLCQQDEHRQDVGKPAATAPEEPPTALSALADAAVDDFARRPTQQQQAVHGPPMPGPQLAPIRSIMSDLPPQPQQPPLLPHQQRPAEHPRGLHRTILPQPVLGQMIPPTDPRSFLPPPTHHQPPPPPPPPPSQRSLPNPPRRILPSGSYPSIPHLSELPDPFSSVPPQLPPMAFNPGPYQNAPHALPPPPPPQYMHGPVGIPAGLPPVYHPGMYGHPPPPPPGPQEQHPHRAYHQPQLPPHPQHPHPHQQQQQQQHQQGGPPPPPYSHG